MEYGSRKINLYVMMKYKNNKYKLTIKEYPR